MNIPPISDEQRRVVDVLMMGKNVNIQACAGSGKTTTALHVAMSFGDKKILLLTYNARLKAETRERAVGCTNMEVHSYHSFAVRHGRRDAFTDTSLLAFLDSRTGLSGPLDYDIVIVDEAQDMSPLYHRLVVRIIDTLSSDPLIVVMGDRHQSIYDFNRADPRFLTMAPEIFVSDRPWENASLSTTYRLTRQMTEFIGLCCAGAPSMRAVREGPPVEYIITNNYSKSLQRRLLGIVRSSRPTDIFVLAPSIRTATSPIRVLANSMTKAGVPVYVPASDEERLDDDVVRGKVVFSTFHQIKGLERRIVVVFGFDRSYHEYYAKGVSMSTLPNTLFVAITRATHRLILIHDSKKAFLPCVDPDAVQKAALMDSPRSFIAEPPDEEKQAPSLLMREKRVCVSDLIRYLPVDIVAACESLLRSGTRENDGLGVISVPVKTVQDNSLCEAVSEITGTCMPALYESRKTGRVSFLKNTDLCARLSKADPSVMPSILREATAWCARKSGFCFKEIQITSYDWLSMDHMVAACRRLAQIIPDHDKPRFEERLEAVHKRGFRIHGFADIMTSGGMLCELKAVSQLSSEHLIQLAIYMWLCSKTPGTPTITHAVLFNLIDGTSIRIHPTPTDLDALVSLIIEHKASSHRTMTDEQFIRSFRKTP